MEEKRMEKNEEMEVMNEAELEEVNGGVVWAAVYVSCAVIGAGAGLLHGVVKNRF